MQQETGAANDQLEKPAILEMYSELREGGGGLWWRSTRQIVLASNI
jgi:hypothetical protein